LPNTVHQAREALGKRLRELRKDADLTGRDLANLAGWHSSKVSRIEYGKQSPSEDDIRAWCRHCGAENQIPDLITTLRDIESMYVEWRRMQRTGLKRLQESSVPLYERTKTFRIYEPGVIPGLLQTAEYAYGLMGQIISFREIPNDLDDAVAARMERQKVLYSGDRRFLIVLEEQALRTPVGSMQTMAGQLDRLLAVMSLQRLSLGIIPASGRREIWPVEGFWMFDDELTRVETVTASLNVTQPREIIVYAKTFERLQLSALYGPKARQLVSAILTELE
jgi:transcriptional regulator with XRE-family HTH domain